MNISSLFLVDRVITEITKKIILYAQWNYSPVAPTVSNGNIKPFLYCSEELGSILSSCGDNLTPVIHSKGAWSVVQHPSSGISSSWSSVV